jgi:hypothetical protein
MFIIIRDTPTAIGTRLSDLQLRLLRQSIAIAKRHGRLVENQSKFSELLRVTVMAKLIRHLLCGLLDFSVIRFRHLDVEISTAFLLTEPDGAFSQARKIELNIRQNTRPAHNYSERLDATANHREGVRLAEERWRIVARAAFRKLINSLPNRQA